MTDEEKEERKAKYRKLMPGVAELVDAHNAAWEDGPEFIVIRSIDYSTGNRVTKKGFIPYEFPDAPDSESNNNVLSHTSDESN